MASAPQDPKRVMDILAQLRGNIDTAIDEVSKLLPNAEEMGIKVQCKHGSIITVRAGNAYSFHEYCGLCDQKRLVQFNHATSNFSYGPWEPSK